MYFIQPKFNLRTTLILASASPRRKLLLEQAGNEVLVHASHVSELLSHPAGPTALALENARLKAHAVHQALQPNEQDIILGADTIVCLEGKIFGKPRDRAEAERMLSQLSGRWHEVITGVCLIMGAQSVSNIEFWETTRVLFRSLTREEILSYLDRIDPYDKAGAYSAQDGGRETIISQVMGSFSNIVGLPMETLQNFLEQLKQ